MGNWFSWQTSRETELQNYFTSLSFPHNVVQVICGYADESTATTSQTSSTTSPSSTSSTLSSPSSSSPSSASYSSSSPVSSPNTPLPYMYVYQLLETIPNEATRAQTHELLLKANLGDLALHPAVTLSTWMVDSAMTAVDTRSPSPTPASDSSAASSSSPSTSSSSAPPSSSTSSSPVVSVSITRANSLTSTLAATVSNVPASLFDELKNALLKMEATIQSILDIWRQAQQSAQKELGDSSIMKVINQGMDIFDQVLDLLIRVCAFLPSSFTPLRLLLSSTQSILRSVRSFVKCSDLRTALALVHFCAQLMLSCVHRVHMWILGGKEPEQSKPTKDTKSTSVPEETVPPITSAETTTTAAHTTTSSLDTTTTCTSATAPTQSSPVTCTTSTAPLTEPVSTTTEPATTVITTAAPSTRTKEAITATA